MLSSPLPCNIREVADANAALLERVGFTPGQDNPLEIDTPELYIASGLFTAAQTETIFESTGKEAPEPQNDWVYPARMGALLVRPDMRHTADSVEARLSETGHTIIDKRSIVVTPEMYLTLYLDAMTSRELTHTRLTRAAVYMGAAGILYVVDKPAVNDTPTADALVRNLKGQQGVHQPGTVRGEIVYDAAVRLGAHDADRIDASEQLATAVDPFGAYRAVVRRHPHKQPHAGLSHPLLAYTGVGVHFPNYAELQRDLRVLAPDINLADMATS